MSRPPTAVHTPSVGATPHIAGSKPSAVSSTRAGITPSATIRRSP